MDWDARGMHVHLLNLSWQQDPPGSIPDDVGTIRRWLGLPSGFADADRVWARVWPQISAAWALKDGRRYNEGLVASWNRQQTYKQNGSKRRANPELSLADEEEDAKNLPPLALAQKIAAELCLTGPTILHAIAGAIEFSVKHEAKTPNQAVETLIAKGREAQKRGEKMQFWFQDRGWNKATNGSGPGRGYVALRREGA